MEDYQSFLVSSGRVSPGEYPSKTPRVPSHVPVKLLPSGFQQGDQKGYHVAHLNGDSPSCNHRSRVVSLSAKDERAAKMMVENLKRYLITRGEENEGRTLDNLTYTLGQCRTRFPWVASLAVESISGLVSALDTQARPSKSSGVSRLGFGDYLLFSTHCTPYIQLTTGSIHGPGGPVVGYGPGADSQLPSI